MAKEEDWKELHEMIAKFCIERGIEAEETLGYFSETLIINIARGVPSDKLIIKNFEKMKKRTLSEKKRFQKEQKEATPIFSKELRDRMAKFGSMSVEEALGSKEFLRELGRHGGMTEEEMDNIEASTPEEKAKFDSMTKQEYYEYFNNMIEDKLPDVIEAMKKSKESKE